MALLLTSTPSHSRADVISAEFTRALMAPDLIGTAAMTQPTSSTIVQDRSMVISQLQALVAQLTKQLADLLAQKAAQQGSDVASALPRVSHLSLTRTLSYGSKGDDVASLQRFLIQEGLLPPDFATGFFGRATEKAVQAWQTRTGIISSGTPESTGYGVVGVKTRATFGTHRTNAVTGNTGTPSASMPDLSGRTPTSGVGGTGSLSGSSAGSASVGMSGGAGINSGPDTAQAASSGSSAIAPVVTAGVKKDLISDYGDVSQASFIRAIADAREYFKQNASSTYVLMIPAGTFDLTAIPAGTNPKGVIDVSGIRPDLGGQFTIQGAGEDKTTLIMRDDKVNGSDIFGIYGTDVYRTTFRGINFSRPHYKVSQGHVVSESKGKIVLDIQDGFPSPLDIFETSWQQGDPVRRFLKQYTDSTDNPRIIPEDQGNTQIPWLSAAQVSGTPGRWEFALVQSNLTPAYPVGALVGIKSKFNGTAYWFCRGSDITFDHVRWTHEARGVFRCGINNVRVTNSSIVRPPPINGQAAALSTTGGGPQIGQPNDPQSSGHVVENNTFIATGDNSIAFFNASGVVRNNTIIDSFSPGILLYFSPDVELENNSILGTTILRQDAHCEFPDGSGVIVPFGSEVTAYQSATVPAGQQCVSQQRQCVIQGLTGTYAYASCVAPPKSCTFGTSTIQSGQSVTAYVEPLVAAGSTCTQEQRVCTDGTLSGSYPYSSCSVSAPQAAFETIGSGLPSSWRGIQSTLTGDPQSGWNFTETANAGAHYLALASFPPQTTTSDTWRVRVYAKTLSGSSRDIVRIVVRNNDNAANSTSYARCSLTAGTVVASHAGYDSSGLGALARGDGDWRVCELVVKPDSLASASLRIFVQLEDSSGNVSYIGDGSSGIVLRDITVERKIPIVSFGPIRAQLASVLAALDALIRTMLVTNP